MAGLSYTVEQGPHVFSASDDKRFKIPGAVIKTTCVECGKPVERDFGGEPGYLSYPTIGKPLQEYVYCGREWKDENDEWDSCEGQTPVWIELDITVKAVDAPEPT